MTVRTKPGLPPLAPPAGIEGKMHKATPLWRKEWRAKYIAECIAMGYTRKDVARALGISTSSLQRFAPSYNPLDPCTRSTPPVGEPWGNACRWVDFSPEQRKALYEAARENGCETPGEFMTEVVRDWLADHAEC